MDNTAEYSNPISLRLPRAMLQEIDAYAAEAATRAGVRRITRTEAILALLEKGIREATRRKDGKGGVR